MDWFGASISSSHLRSVWACFLVFLGSVCAQETLNNRRRRLRDKSSVEPVRVATMQWMLDINHSMHWLGSSLSDFFISEEDIKQSEQPPT